MWRSLFLALGVYCSMLGVEALAIERAVLKPPQQGQRRLIQTEEIVPPDWAPWSLMGTGAVVVLYSFTIPQRVRRD